MISFSEFLLEAKKKKERSKLGDSAGKLFELLKASHQNNGEFPEDYRAEGKKPADIYHKTGKKLLGDDYNSHSFMDNLRNAADIASRVNDEYNRTHGHVPEKGYKRIAWTSQPSDHKSETGVEDPNSVADSIVTLHNGKKIGHSDKLTGINQPVNFKNPGMQTLMGLVNSQPATEEMQAHSDLVKSFGLSSSDKGHDEFKRLRDSSNPEEREIANQIVSSSSRVNSKFTSNIRRSFQEIFEKEGDEGIKKRIKDLVAGPTHLPTVVTHTEVNDQTGEHHRTRVYDLHTHTQEYLDHFTDISPDPLREGQTSVTLRGTYRHPTATDHPQNGKRMAVMRVSIYSGGRPTTITPRGSVSLPSLDNEHIVHSDIIDTLKHPVPERSKGSNSPVERNLDDGEPDGTFAAKTARDQHIKEETIVLTEATADPSKQTHLEHFEDLAFGGPDFNGHEGVGLADKHLREVHNYLLGAKRNTPQRVETKVDGAPTFHIFKDNEGRIGVGTKSMFNKNPKLNFTEEDIDANHGHAPGLAAVLKQILTHAHKMVPSNMRPAEIYKGDFLFGDDSSGRGRETTDYFHEFQPNTLRYKVPKDSPEGAQVANAKVGVALHTYFGPDGVAGPIDKKRRASFIPHPDVYNYDPSVRVNPVNYTPVEQRAFEEHMENARKAYTRIKPEVYDDLVGHDQHMRTYTNQRVRAGAEGPGNVDEYLSFLNDRAQKDINSTKTQVAKDRKTKQNAALMQQVVQNAKHVQNIFDLHNHLQNAKNVLIGVAGKNSPETVELPDGSPTGHEGYVSTIKTDDGGQHQAKLVNRTEFANFIQGSLRESVEWEEKTLGKRLLEAFFLTESVRQGLPHITTMKHEQFSNLVKDGKVKLTHATEKTDGGAFVIGHDGGFYTQSSGSGNERMRNPEDYAERARRRSQETGKPLDLTAANAFSKAHAAIQKNKALLQYLQSTAENNGGETQVRGELFSRALSRPSETPGEIKFVGTSYDPSHMGSVGKFVIHTELPENQHHDVEKFKSDFSTKEFNFDDDRIEGFKPSEVDVSQHLEGMKNINTDILNARKTKKNADEKAEETAKFDAIKQKVSDAVDKHVENMNISPKWGSGSEGLVVHPEEGSGAPRFKITSKNFREYKASDEAKNFKKRTPVVEKLLGNFYDNSNIFKRFIIEGGNIKVKDSEGNEVAAAPFAVSDRPSQSKDVYDALHAIHNSFQSETGKHLFGENARSLSTGSAYSGSTKQFMNKDSEAGNISDREFKTHKPTVGDIDVQVPREHKEALHAHLTSNIGGRFGKYTLIGIKKSGNETHAVMRHDNGEHHQFDFEHVTYQKDEPAEHEQFLHSSSWEDTKNGIKGAHHKILLNAIASASGKKFSITHGLRSRTNVDDPGVTAPREVSNSLFGPNADHGKINSFVGISNSIKKHIPIEKHQEIYDKFKNSMLNNKNVDSKKAIEYLKTTLGAKD